MRNSRFLVPLLIAAVGGASALALQPQATFDRSLVPHTGTPQSGADDFCDIQGQFTYPDDADPFGIAYDAVTDTIWIASQAATSGNTLKQWANPIGGAPLTECALPTTGAGNGVAVTSQGTLLVTDFQGDLTAFDDHVMEIDTSCNLIRFWAIDDASCGGGCPVNPSSDRIDAVLGIDFVGDSADGYEVVIVDFVNTFTHRVNLVTNDPGPGLSSDWSETGTGDIQPLLGVGVDNTPSADGLSHISGIDVVDGLQKNACYDGEIENDPLSVCTSPSDPALTLITGITELPNGSVLQGDLDGISGTVYTLEGCGDCFIDVVGPTLQGCPGPNVICKVTGNNRSSALAILNCELDGNRLVDNVAVAPGPYAIAPNVQVPGFYPPVCPFTSSFTCTLSCEGGAVASGSADIELISRTQ